MVMGLALVAFIALPCRWRSVAHRPLLPAAHEPLAQIFVHIGRDGADANPPQRHRVPVPHIAADSLTHGLRQSLHLMPAAQSFIFGRRGGVALNLAPDAEHSQGLLAGLDIDLGTGVGRCQYIFHGFQAALWPWLSAGYEAFGGLLQRLSLRRLGAPQHRPLVGMDAAGSLE